MFESMYYGNSLQAWLIACGIFVGVLAALAIVRSLLLKKIKPRTRLREFVKVMVEHTRFLFLAIVAMSLASSVLKLPEVSPRLLRVFAAVVVLLQMAWWGHGGISFCVRQVTKARAQSDIGSVTTIRALGMLAKAMLWVMLGLSVVASFGIDVTALIAGLGIGGIAIALAVQNVVGDLFASVSIILDKPFLVGDFIKVGDQAGTVQRVGIKTTRLRSVSGEELVFGNGDLLGSRIRNYRKMTERRAVFTIGVEYGTPQELLRKVPQLIRGAIEAQNDTRVDRVHFSNYGDSALNFEAVYFVLKSEYNAYMDIQQAINFQIYDELSAAGIEIAFPTRTVVLRVDPSSQDAIAQGVIKLAKSVDVGAGAPRNGQEAGSTA